MHNDMQLGTETLNLLLECVRDFLTQRKLVLISNEEWWEWTDQDRARVAYSWHQPVAPHEKPASIASATAVKLRELLQKQSIDKWTRIVILLELTQPVAPETRKHFLVIIRLA
jgi:hypothetical protein